MIDHDHEVVRVVERIVLVWPDEVAQEQVEEARGEMEEAVVVAAVAVAAAVAAAVGDGREAAEEVAVLDLNCH